MKKIFIWIGLVNSFVLPTVANSTGISVNIGQPGLYGQITLGNQHSNPQLIYPNPVTAIPTIGHPQQPIYLHVPPGHAKKWSKHCHRYNACGKPAYFVQENWYNNTYRTDHQNQNSYSDGHTVKKHHHSHSSNIHGKNKDPNHLVRNNHSSRGKHDQKIHHAKKHEKGHPKNR